MEKQGEININVQKRLRALEARENVMIALLAALIDDHPDRDSLEKKFDSHVERFRATALPSTIAEDFLDELDGIHKLFSRVFAAAKR